MITLSIKTSRRKEMCDITGQLARAVAEAAFQDGLALVYVPHTTAGITINENADPDVPRDILTYLQQLVPDDGDYRHQEGNSDAHIQAGLMGSSVTVMIENGELVLGTWQSLFFCEFDGPRSRKIFVKFVEGIT